MLLLPFFEIPYGEKVAKNVKKQYVQVLPRSTTYGVLMLFTQGHRVSQLKLTVKICKLVGKQKT